MDDGGVAKLVARTYRAATEPALLAGVFEELGDRLRAEGWHFLGWDHDAGADLVGLASWTVLDAKLLPAYALGLTPAEARLARALCGEESLQDYARASGVARTTVKTQLRSIFAKTGTTRQSALVRLVAAVPPARGGETARHRGRQADPKAR